MATVYDWSPLFDAINGATNKFSQQNQYNGMIDALGGKPTYKADAPPMPGDSEGQTSSGTPTYSGALAGVNPAMLQAIRSAPPSVGLPLLLQLATKEHKYGQTPQYDQNGNAFVLDDQGNMKPLDGVKARTKIEVTAAGDAYDPYSTAPGTHFAEKNNPNQPFNADGTPNKAYQEYKAAEMRAQQAPQWANYNLSKQKMDNAVPDEGTLHDMATRFVNGDRQAAVGLGRNPMMQMAFQKMVSQVGHERGMSQEQISGNLQTFAAGTKAVQAFDTGKQGDTTRSLNVSVAHLSTLKDLGAALQNGDVTLINAARQKFAEAFGVPAPTNFDAARAIVADEVAKGVIGGQTAQADREALAASLKRERSPQAINGAISTFQNLLAGQLHGLRQQYKSSTGRQDFNDKLFPETVSVLETSHGPKAGSGSGGGANGAPAPVTKTIGNVTYHLVNGKWMQ